MDTGGVILVCAAAYSIIRYVNRVFDDKPGKDVKRQPAVKKKIQCLVNEKEINVPHHIYYQDMLNLYGRNDITDDLICRESRLLEEIADNHNKFRFFNGKDIKAARCFLLDQWAYFARWN